MKKLFLFYLQLVILTYASQGLAYTDARGFSSSEPSIIETQDSRGFSPATQPNLRQTPPLPAPQTIYPINPGSGDYYPVVNQDVIITDDQW